MPTDVIGEFLGTAFLVLLGDGVVANVSLDRTKGKDAGWLAITIGWGLAVAIAAYATGHMGPAHLNPAVSLAFALRGAISWGTFLAYTAAQVLGAILGACGVWLLYRPHYAQTEDPDTILGTFATAPAIDSPLDNVIAEVIGTFVLAYGILAFAYTDMAPGIGTAVVSALIVSIGVSLGGPTGYAINPARDLGPRLAHSFLPIPHKGSSQWSYAWVPILGPMLGSLLAAGLDLLLNA